MVSDDVAARAAGDGEAAGVVGGVVLGHEVDDGGAFDGGEPFPAEGVDALAGGVRVEAGLDDEEAVDLFQASATIADSRTKPSSR